MLSGYALITSARPREPALAVLPFSLPGTPGPRRTHSVSNEFLPPWYAFSLWVLPLKVGFQILSLGEGHTNLRTVISGTKNLDTSKMAVTFDLEGQSG